jgi:hypothetical protein
VRLSIYVPDYLNEALRARATDESSTIRHLVIEGLRALGFHVEAADLVPDRRRTHIQPKRS